MSYGSNSTEELLERYGVSDSRLRDDILRDESSYSSRGFWTESDHVWETARGDTVINGFDIDTGEWVGHDFDA